MSLYYLPRLKSNSQLAVANSVWKDDTQGGQGRLLSILPDDLEIQGEGYNNPEDITGIPSPFARQFLFEQALFNADHPLHKKIEAEWRGLLGVLCFRDTLNLRGILTSTPYKIKEDSSPFGRILSEFLPGDTWNDNYIISLGYDIIGITSPLTLFCTPKDYRISSKVVGWIDENGRLYDPIDSIKSFPITAKEYLKRLFLWIETNRVALGGNITGALVNWKEDIKKVYEELYPNDQDLTIIEAAVRGIQRQQLNGMQLVIGEETYSFEALIDDNRYSNLSCSIVKIVNETNNPVKSDIYISGSKTILVSEENLDGDKIVYDNGRIVLTGSYIRSLEGLNNLPDVERIKPDELFSNYILQIGLSNDTLNYRYRCRQGEEEVTYTLPFSEKFFQFFGKEDLERDLESLKFSLSKSQGDTIEVSLDIPLNNGKSVRYRREYRRGENLLGLNPPVTPYMSLWPNFMQKGWNVYYLFYYESQEVTVDRQKLELKFTDVEVEQTERRNEVVWKLDRFPKKIFFKAGNKDLGVVLLLSKAPGMDLNPNREWTIGVDLGTSNTFIAKKEGDAGPSTLDFSSRHMLISNHKPEDVEETLSTSFFPFNKHTDFPTLLRMLRRDEQPEQWKSVINGIAFLYPLVFPKNSYRYNGIEHDLKWATEREKIQELKVYLEHLLLMVMAEAKYNGVGRIKVRWSYPSSLPGNLVVNRRNFWNYYKALFHIDSVEEEAESLAITKYFKEIKNANPNAESPTIFIDIGGGSTDIAIWGDGEVKCQTSLQIAGNHILGRYMKVRNELLDALSSIIIENENERNAFLDLRDRLGLSDTVLFNALLSFKKPQEEQDNHKKLISYISTGPWEDPKLPFLDLRKLMLTFIGGIIYFCGLLVKKYFNQENTNVVDLYMTGKASKMIDWISTERERLTNDILPKFLKSALDREDLDSRIEIADNPKEAVAYGLTVQEIQVRNNTPVQISPPTYILGEDNCRIGNELKDFKYEIGENEFSNIQIPKSIKDLIQFNKFLETLKSAYQEIFGTQGLIPTSNRFSTDFINQMRSIKREIDIGREDIRQPIFVVELRALINILNEYLRKNH